MKFRKSQAAIEFLMTYGCAILVVLVAFISLWYFGVFQSNDEFGIPKDLSNRANFVCNNLIVDEFFDDNTMAIRTYTMLHTMGKELLKSNNYSYYQFNGDNSHPYGGIGVDCLDEKDLEDDLCSIDEQEIISMICSVPTRLCYEEVKGDGAYCILMEIDVPIEFKEWKEWYIGLNINK